MTQPKALIDYQKYSSSTIHIPKCFLTMSKYLRAISCLRILKGNND
jgi:hypothetical protein